MKCSYKDCKNCEHFVLIGENTDCDKEFFYCEKIGYEKLLDLIYFIQKKEGRSTEPPLKETIDRWLENEASQM